jgi:hypothetical protein
MENISESIQKDMRNKPPAIKKIENYYFLLVVRWTASNYMLACCIPILVSGWKKMGYNTLRNIWGRNFWISKERTVTKCEKQKIDRWIFILGNYVFTPKRFLFQCGKDFLDGLQPNPPQIESIQNPTYSHFTSITQVPLVQIENMKAHLNDLSARIIMRSESLGLQYSIVHNATL